MVLEHGLVNLYEYLPIKENFQITFPDGFCYFSDGWQGTVLLNILLVNDKVTALSTTYISYNFFYND